MEKRVDARGASPREPARHDSPRWRTPARERGEGRARGQERRASTCARGTATFPPRRRKTQRHVLLQRRKASSVPQQWWPFEVYFNSAKKKWGAKAYDPQRRRFLDAGYHETEPEALTALTRLAEFLNRGEDDDRAQDIL